MVRKSLASEKSDGAVGVPYGKNPNMISVTGQEAGGWLISPSTVTVMFFVYIGIVVALHKFGKNIPYGVHPSLLSVNQEAKGDL